MLQLRLEALVGSALRPTLQVLVLTLTLSHLLARPLRDRLRLAGRRLHLLELDPQLLCLVLHSLHLLGELLDFIRESGVVLVRQALVSVV